MRDWLATSNVIGESATSVVGCIPDSQVVRSSRWRVLRGSLLAKLARLKTERRRLHRDTYSYSLYLFNPGKMMLVPDSSQPGISGKLRFDECFNFSVSSRRRSRSKSPSINLRDILATISRMGNIFLHIVQTTEPLGEDYGLPRVELWNNEPIEAFVLVTRR